MWYVLLVNNDGNDNVFKMMKWNYDNDNNNIILPTQGRLHDPQYEKGKGWCKRLPPPRFYIPLLFEISPLLLPGNELVVCGGFVAWTSCESWRPGQEEWTDFKEMRWVFYFDHWSSWWSGDDHHGGGCDHEVDWWRVIIVTTMLCVDWETFSLSSLL